MKNDNEIINMKKDILLLVLSLLLFMTVDTQAQEWCVDSSCFYEDSGVHGSNFYAKIFSGDNFLQNTSISGDNSTYQIGYIITGSLGYCWREDLRLEAEYAFRRNAIQKIHFYGEGISRHGHFQTSSYMANLLWDLPLATWNCACWNLQPFIGAGIGYDLQQIHSSNSRIIFNQKWNHFSWQMMAGLTYPILCHTEITLEYKFHQGGCKFNDHSVGVGLVYKFGWVAY
jgi:opacity protein-like surface antigen